MYLIIIKPLLLVIHFLCALSGVVIIVLGAAYAFHHFIKELIKHPDGRGLGLDVITVELGKSIILGLDFIVASDIIKTIVTPDYYGVGILALLVLIRISLSYFIGREIKTLAKTK